MNWRKSLDKRLDYLQTLELLKTKPSRRPRHGLATLEPDYPNQQNDDEDSFGRSTRPLVGMIPVSWALFDGKMPRWVEEYQIENWGKAGYVEC